MPTYYFIITNKDVKNMVNNHELTNLEHYLNSHDIEDSYDLRLYHILSYATDVANIDVLKYFKNKINLDYSPDGNAYNLLHLAIENYVNKYTTHNTKLFDIIILLTESHIKNHNTAPSGNYLRHLISLGSKHKDYTLLTKLVREYDMCISDMYHYSIVWGHKDVFDYLISNFDDVIDYDNTFIAIEIACGFDHHDVAKYVASCVEKKYPEMKDELTKTMKKCGINQTTFILKNDHDCSKLVIPDDITHIETTYDFNKNIDKIKWSSNLLSLKIGALFNQSIDKVKLPDTVEHISFGINNNWSSFKQSLHKFHFPKSLKEYINQGAGVKESVDEIVFPDSTEVIRLGFNYNVPINKFKFPLAIEEFEFSCGYSQSLKDVVFPKDITLTFYQTSAEPILSIYNSVHCLYIKCINSGKNGEMTHLPPDLKVLMCLSESDKKQIKCSLPDTWEWKKDQYGVWICCDHNKN